MTWVLRTRTNLPGIPKEVVEVPHLLWIPAGSPAQHHKWFHVGRAAQRWAAGATSARFALAEVPGAGLAGGFAAAAQDWGWHGACHWVHD